MVYASAMRRLLGLLALACVSGCDFGTLDDLSQDDPEQGSEELTGQARAVWNAYDKPDDAVKRAVADIEGVLARAEGLTSERPLKLKIGDLTSAELRAVGLEARDATIPQGMLVAPELDCPLDQIEKLVVAKNQTELYPKLYDSYTRTYTSNVQDFLARKAPVATWTTEYQASAIGNTYVAKLSGGARRVPGAAPDGKDVLLARTYLNAPATFSTAGDAEFNQDYQIELYWERTPGKTLHFYGLWREFRIASLTSEADLYVSLVLGNLVDFDVRSAKVCKDGAPVPTF